MVVFNPINLLLRLTRMNIAFSMYKDSPNSSLSMYMDRAIFDPIKHS